MRVTLIIATMAVTALAACGERRERDITLRDFRMNRSSPEEFSILPKKPLSLPENLAALPAPTEDGNNLTDPTPLADATIALGGRPQGSIGGIPASDGALVNYAGRKGLDAAIRSQLAAEDLQFRKRKSRFTWKIVPTDDYLDAYRRETLDPYAETDRFRRAGVRVPSSPPRGR